MKQVQLNNQQKEVKKNSLRNFPKQVRTYAKKCRTSYLRMLSL